jgi:DNA-binding transcriptional ArsR family regulator
MARRLPPLKGLKAFEAAARSESFTRAAEELNVTQGAVSHQVKALEETLGVKLFHRERQRLILTETGGDTWSGSIRSGFFQCVARSWWRDATASRGLRTF